MKKRFIQCLISVFFLISANGYLLADGPEMVCLKIEVHSGEQILKGYVTIPDYYLNKDSIENSGYVKDRLVQWSTPDTLEFYQEKVEYYFSMEGWEADKVFALLKPIHIHTDQIVKLRILQTEIAHKHLGLGNITSQADTSWMRRKPLERVTLHANLCEYYLFIHKKNDELTAVIETLKNLKYPEEELYESLNKLRGFKVAIVVFCTC